MDGAESAHGHSHSHGASCNHSHGSATSHSHGHGPSTEPQERKVPLAARRRTTSSRSAMERGCQGLGRAQTTLRTGAVNELERNNRQARKTLWIVSAFCALFMIAEFIGGYLANSLAIMTDAAHLLSDLAGFLISIFALTMAMRSPTRRLSFGYHRAEIIGALASILLIWVLTGVLVYEAVHRIINPEEVEGKIMFITAAAGFGVNLIMGVILLRSGHGHSHGGLPDHSEDGGHGGHGHSHGSPKKSRSLFNPSKGRGKSDLESPLVGGDSVQAFSSGGAVHHSHSHGGEQEWTEEHDEEEDHGHSHGHGHGPAEETNINVTAALVHVAGDAVQTIGVMIAAAVIWYNPEWKIADPICTFLFSILVLLTTVRIVAQSLRVLMEGAPDRIEPALVEESLNLLPGVIEAHDLHLWSLSVGKPSLSVHLLVEDGNNDVLQRATSMLAEQYNIHHVTIQIENETQDELACNPYFRERQLVVSDSYRVQTV